VTLSKQALEGGEFALRREGGKVPFSVMNRAKDTFYMPMYEGSFPSL
jgi:hypothetical protein